MTASRLNAMLGLWEYGKNDVVLNSDEIGDDFPYQNVSIVSTETSHVNYLQFLENFNKHKHKMPVCLHIFGSIEQVLYLTGDAVPQDMDRRHSTDGSIEEEFGEVHDSIDESDTRKQIIHITTSLKELTISSSRPNTK